MTTKSAVTLGPRQLFTQLQEPFTDKFLLTDLNLKYDLGPGVSLTSITSYVHRDVLVVRDATALTGSVTGGSIGLSESLYTLDAPLNDATTSNVWTQELRLAGGSGRLKWLVGGFYGRSKRHYGQSVLVQRFDTAAAAELGKSPGWTKGTLGARVNELFFSDLHNDLNQAAAFGEATLTATDRLNLTAGLRYYHFTEDRSLIFDGIFAVPTDTTGTTDANGVAPRFIVSYKASDALTLNAQASRGFRLGGINDPLNKPLCSAADIATYGPLQGHWKDETAWNYEMGAKSQFAGGRASLNLSGFYMDIRDLQLTVTAGGCSSRLILNAPKARSVGAELEFTASPNEHLDFSVSTGLNNSKLLSNFKDQAGNVVAGIADGNRLPSVPQIPGRAAVTYRWQVAPGSRVFVAGSYQHVGSRFTLIDDHGGGVFCPPPPHFPFGTGYLRFFLGTTLSGSLNRSPAAPTRRVTP